jgi:abortive infection bacteriophage resistance protein
MKYEKKPTTFEEQADKLLSRGLVADREELLQRLIAVNYYRLSGYLYPFRESGSDQYREGTTLKLIWGRYCFDRRLRVLVLDAIERIEVSARTKLVHHFSHDHGPFGYLDDRNLPNLKINEYLEWRANLVEETHRSKETFIKHFFTTYGDCHKELPVWMLAEVMSMGSTLTFF